MKMNLPSSIRVTIPLLLIALLLLTLAACGGDSSEDTTTAPAATTAPAPGGAAPTTAPGAAAANTAPDATAVPAATGGGVVPTSPPRSEATPTPEPAQVTAAGYWREFVDQGKYGGILREGHIYENDHWSPWVGCCNRSVFIARNPYNLLVMRNPADQNTIVGDLAESWEWADDGNSVTFNIAQNATWFDGQPVTAEDVVFSLDNMTDLDQIRPRTRNVAPYYASSEAIDAHTVKVNTKFANPAALIPFLTVDFMVMHPKHVLEGKPDDVADFFADPENLVGSGAFMYKTRELGSSMEVEKNPNYFKEGLPFLDGIKVFVINDRSRLGTALEVGQIDWAPGAAWTEPQLKDLANALEGKGRILYTPKTNVFRYYEFNIDNPPVSDPRVRRAIYIAFDSKQQVEITRLGNGSLGIPFFPDTWMSATAEEISEWPGFRYVDKDSGELYIGDPVGVPNLVKDPADLQMARDLLAEAGFPDGLELDYLYADIFEEEAILLRENMKAIGLDLNLLPRDTTTAANAEQSGEYRHMLGFGHGTNIIDPDDVFLGVYMPGGPRNALRYEDPAVSAVFEKQKSEPDQVARRELIAEAEEIIRQGEGHGRPMFWHPMEQLIHQNYVKNMNTAPFTVQYGYQKEHVWLEQ